MSPVVLGDSGGPLPKVHGRSSNALSKEVGSSHPQIQMLGSSIALSEKLGLLKAMESSGQPSETLGVTVSNPLLARESNNPSPSVEPAACTTPPQSTRKKLKKPASTRRKKTHVYDMNIASFFPPLLF